MSAEPPKKRHILRIALFAILVITAVCSISSLGSWGMLRLVLGCGAKVPTSTELVDHFWQHRDEFEQLLDMYLTDVQNERVANDYEHNHSLEFIAGTPERYQAYKDLMRNASVEILSGVGNCRHVSFVMWSTGLGISGRGKCIVYTCETPSLIVPDADAYDGSPNSGMHGYDIYQHITGNWYVYIDIR